MGATFMELFVFLALYFLMDLFELVSDLNKHARKEEKQKNRKQKRGQ